LSTGEQAKKINTFMVTIKNPGSVDDTAGVKKYQLEHSKQ